MTKTADQLARLDEILARLEALEGTGVRPGTQAAPTDAYGNPGASLLPGDLIESAWGNSTADHTIYRFPNANALRTWAPANGKLATATDTNVTYLRDAGAWKATVIGARPSFRLTGGAPGQTIQPNTATAILWGAEVFDPTNVVVNGVFTVPGEWGGRWVFDWSTQIEAGEGTGAFESWIHVNGTTRLGLQTVGATEGNVDQSGSVSALLPAGATVNVVMFMTNPVAMVVNKTADQYFQGYYNGPL